MVHQRLQYLLVVYKYLIYIHGLVPPVGRPIVVKYRRSNKNPGICWIAPSVLREVNISVDNNFNIVTS